MGNKKRNTDTGPKLSPVAVQPLPVVDEDAVFSSQADTTLALVKAYPDALLLSNNKIESSPLPMIESDCEATKVECERALTALRRGNHTKALRLMNASLAKTQPQFVPASKSSVEELKRTTVETSSKSKHVGSF